MPRVLRFLGRATRASGKCKITYMIPVAYNLFTLPDKRVVTEIGRHFVRKKKKKRGGIRSRGNLHAEKFDEE